MSSINIQTANGLLEIGGKVTEEKIVSALGYVPAKEEDLINNIVEDESGNLTLADENGNVIMKVDSNGVHTTEVIANGIEVGKTISEHTSNTNLHVSSDEKQTWSNKSDFSGVYADLIDAPSIEETESGNMVVTDENGNIIMQVDAEGVTTTNVNTNRIELDGKDLGVRLDEIESISLHNIVDNKTGDLMITDESGNAIMKVDASGVTTTGISAKTLSLNGEDIGIKIDSHIEDSVSHITSEERTTWNNKSDFSGDFNDLINKPNITDDESGEMVYTDSNGNIIAKINENGFETTTVTANTLLLDGENIGTKIDEHFSDENTHVTLTEKETWNNKSDFSGDYNDLINKPNIEDNTSGDMIVVDNSGNIIMEVDANGVTTTAVNVKAIELDGKDLDERLDQLEAISLPNILDNESGDLTISDKSGNTIMKVDVNGLETTTVTADSAIVNGVDITAKLDEHKESIDDIGKDLTAHTSNKDIHITEEDRNIWNTAINKNADDIGKLSTSLSSHTSNETVHITANERTTWNNKANQSDFEAHTDNKTNPHGVTKAQVGLGNVNNTSDANKPVSTAQQAALNSLKSELTESIASTYETKTDAQTKFDTAKEYTDNKVSGLASTSMINSAINTHNSSSSAHNDIRELITGLTNRLNTLADSDDITLDQMSEVVAYIKSNKTLIESITTSKINVSDIVNDLTTASATKVLSSNQGVILKGLIDALEEVVAGKADSDHYHTITATATDDDIVVLTGTNDSNGVIFDAKHATSGASAGTYKSVTVNVYGHVTEGSNPTTIDEYGITDAYTKSHVDSALSNKSDIGHIHAIEDISGLREALDESKEELNATKTVFFLKDIENGYTYAVQMKGGNLVTSCEVSSIEVATQPNKTVYFEGEQFNPTGMKVVAICADGTVREVTDYTYSLEGTTVTITYIEYTKIYTTTLEITLGELIDFYYVVNGDGTYTITDWKQTFNGDPSTELIVPDNGKFIL